MKKVDYLILSSTETPEHKPVLPACVIDLHTAPAHLGGKGWNRPGFDYLVSLDGTLHTMIPEQAPSEVDLWGIASGSEPLHGNAKILAYAGGRTAKNKFWKDTRTIEQQATLETIVKFYVARFPNIRVLGMNQVPAKKGDTNPGFNVGEWCRDIGLPQENIYQCCEP